MSNIIYGPGERVRARNLAYREIHPPLKPYIAAVEKSEECQPITRRPNKIKTARVVRERIDREFYPYSVPIESGFGNPGSGLASRLVLVSVAQAIDFA